MRAFLRSMILAAESAIAFPGMHKPLEEKCICTTPTVWRQRGLTHMGLAGISRYTIVVAEKERARILQNLASLKTPFRIRRDFLEAARRYGPALI